MSEELNQVDQPEVVEEQELQETPEEVEDTTALQEKLNKEVEARRELTARAKKAEAERKTLEAKLNNIASQKVKSLDVEDYIDISASLEGLDQREKTYLAEQHKMTGKPLKDIRNDENFLLWQDAYRAKVEKERALKPNSAQSSSDKPTSLTEKLKKASLEDKEKLLTEAGLYKSPRPRADRVSIGGIR